MSIRKRDRSYLLNLLLAIDQFFSACCNYDADVSISAALGEIQWTQYQGQNIGWKLPLKAIIQRWLEKAEKDHCLKAYLYELRKRSLAGTKELAEFLKT